MKRLFITMVLVGSLLVSCTKFHESTGYEQLDNTTPKIGMLKFDSKQSLLNLIHGNEQTSDNLIKQYNEENSIDSLQFISLTAPISTRYVLADPILKFEGSKLDVDWTIQQEIHPRVSMYKVLGYDTLVPNRRFAKLLNARGEIAIGDTIYKISPKGTYYFEQSLKSQFEESFSTYENTDGIAVSENLVEVDEGVYRYATFTDSESRLINDPDKPEELPSEANDNYVTPTYWTDTDYTPEGDLTVNQMLPIAVGENRNQYSIPWSTFPVFDSGAKTVVGQFWESLIGRNVSFVSYLSNKRRLKGKFYYYNYIIYAEIGISSKFQKKNWIGWSGTKADHLFMGWSNIMFENSYEEIPTYPQNPVPHIASFTIKSLPGIGYLSNVLTIVGLNLSELSKIIMSTMTPTALNNWLNINVPGYRNHYNIEDIDVIQFYSANKVVTLLTNGYMHLSNCESLDYTFLKDWGFSVNIDLVNLPNSYLDWAQRLNAKELLIKPKHLKYGAMFTAAQLDGQWAGMTITKD